MNFLIGEDTYLWLYINFRNQINVGIRVLNSLNRQGIFSNLFEFFFFLILSNKEKWNHEEIF